MPWAARPASIPHSQAIPVMPPPPSTTARFVTGPSCLPGGRRVAAASGVAGLLPDFPRGSAGFGEIDDLGGGVLVVLAVGPGRLGHRGGQPVGGRADRRDLPP